MTKQDMVKAFETWVEAEIKEYPGLDWTRPMHAKFASKAKLGVVPRTIRYKGGPVKKGTVVLWATRRELSKDPDHYESPYNFDGEEIEFWFVGADCMHIASPGRIK